MSPRGASRGRDRTHVPWASCRELAAPDGGGWIGTEGQVVMSRPPPHLLCPGGCQGLAGNLNPGLSPDPVSNLSGLSGRPVGTGGPKVGGERAGVLCRLGRVSSSSFGNMSSNNHHPWEHLPCSLLLLQFQGTPH